MLDSRARYIFCSFGLVLGKVDVTEGILVGERVRRSVGLRVGLVVVVGVGSVLLGAALGFVVGTEVGDGEGLTVWRRLGA